MKHVLRWCAALVALALALPAQAAEAVKLSDVANSVFFRGGSGTRGNAGFNGGNYSSQVFNGNFNDPAICNMSGTTELVIDVSHIVTDPDGQAFVTEVVVAHQGNAKYSLYYTTEDEPENLPSYASDPRTWIPIDGASMVQEQSLGDAAKVYGVNQIATAVKYVFESFVSWTGSLAEIEVRGYEYIPAKAVKISALGRSVFFRGGSGTRGNAGFNGGNYSSQVFNGNFNDPAICNMSGTTELVIPTTGWDSDNNVDTGVAWYVTDFKVAHQGNSKYSLYYTTEAEPENLPSYASDPRTWIPIEGASMVQEQSLGDAAKVFGVNKTATAVKYVFESFVSWTASLAEVEVWAMDPSSISCLHPNLESATWSLCRSPTCTDNGFEERFCPDCNERFERENGDDYPKLGHIFVATLTDPGSASGYGSGTVTCSRTFENTTGLDGHVCDFHIDFAGEPVDLTTLGGLPINGVVQYTDLTASSTGGLDGGIAPDDVMDGVWTDGWNGYWFAEGRSHNEYIQYKFGTTIELTQIEFSVLNQYQTVDFYKYDPATDEETLLKSIPLTKDETSGAPGYIRQTVYFQSDNASEKVFVDAIRMRIGDYVDPETGETTAYIGTQYGRPYHTCIIEFHPYGTIEGAGKLLSVAQIGNVGYESLADALDNAEEGDTILLMKDDDVSFSTANLELAIDKALTIDGGGHTLYGVNDYAGGSGDHDIYVSGSGNVTIRNITLANFGGAVPVTGRTYPIWTGSAYSGTLTLDHVTVANFNRTAFNLNGGTVVVKNCTITGDQTKGFQGGVFQEGIGVYNADVTIENTTITGAGSTIEREGSQIAACIQLGNPNGATPGTGSITVRSGTFSGEYGIIVASNATDAVTVQNGTFSGALLVEDGEGGSIAVSGGSFDAPVPAEYCAPEYIPAVITEPVVDGETGEVTTPGVYGVEKGWKVSFVNEKGEAPGIQCIALDGTNALYAAVPRNPMPPEGFDFTGWFAPGETNAFDFANTAITNDLTLTAGWEAVAAEPDPVDPGEGLSDEEIADGAVPAGIQKDPTTGDEAFVVCFHGQAGMTYTLQGSTTLDPADWTSTDLIVGTPVECTVDGQLIKLEFPMGANIPDAMFFKIGTTRTAD